MARRLLALVALVSGLIVATPAAAFACGGLIAGKHAEVLRRATTLAAWADGIEHYITGFTFAGTADSFGYVIPLPAIPSNIRKGGDWTLERLEREAFPPPLAPLAARNADGGTGGVTVVKAVKIDSLDIKVVKGGGRDVAAWAREHGFDLTKDTDAVLGAYRANIFALAKFEKNEAAKRFVEGQGVVIDFEIPLPGPWIPLRILTLGKHATEPVEAHLFLLTPEKPAIHPAPAEKDGMRVVRSEQASDALIRDLRSDTGTSWIPEDMWFTALEMSTVPPNVDYDLSAVSGGVGVPYVPGAGSSPWLWWSLAGVAGASLALARRARVRAATGSLG